jgi:NhaA family Na+:H+ antiporter
VAVLIAINAQRNRIATVHPHAKTAAEAAEAAGSQRMFWQMHSTLFAADGPLTNGLLTAAAASFGLNVPSFQKGEKP